jgi:hypothetical protein
MAAHRKLDRRRDDLCVVGFRKGESLIASAMRHSITKRAGIVDKAKSC